MSKVTIKMEVDTHRKLLEIVSRLQLKKKRRVTIDEAISYKFRLYPSKHIEAKLNEQLELCRWLYNKLLEEVNKARKERRKLKPKDTQALIVKLKQEKPELKKVYSKVLQMVNYQLWNNIKALNELRKKGRKVGWLRYKTGNSFKTLNFNQSGFRIKGSKLILSKVGEMRIKLHRAIKGKIKGIIIKRARSGKWYAIVQVEDKPKPLPKTGKAIGIDVGIRFFLTDSEGRQVENPKFYERTLKRIRIEQRRLSRKKEGSRNYEKQRRKLAKAYEKLVNQRNDFLHKLSRFYVNNYDVIVVEDLQIQNMVQNGNLAQKILDASWGKFIAMLSYKAERAGRRVIKVNPKGTSKGLSYKNKLRDYISACRILMRGWDSPDSLLERRPLPRTISYKKVVSGQVFSMNQEAPCISGE